MNASTLSADPLTVCQQAHGGMLAAASERLGDAQRFQEAFDHAAVGIFQSTPSGRFARVNPALAAILGYDTPAAMGAAIKDVKNDLYVHPSDREDFVRTINQNGSIMNFETQVYHRSGEPIWISINAWAVRDLAGQTLHYEGFVEGITEQKSKQASHGRTATCCQGIATTSLAASRIATPLADVAQLLDRLGSTPLSPQQHRYVREARVLLDSAIACLQLAGKLASLRPIR